MSRAPRRPSPATAVLVSAALAAVTALAGCADPGSTPAATAAGGPRAVPTLTPASPTAGASGGATPTGNWDVTALPSPCRLLTQAEVAEGLGVSAGPGVLEDSWPPICHWQLGATADRTFLYVSDNSQPSGKDDFLSRRNGTGQVQPISGLGDQAYWVPVLRTLHILQGATHVSVMVSGVTLPAALTSASVQAKVLAIGRKVLPRAMAPVPSGAASGHGHS